MRATQFLIATQKETPADAEVVSHQLMQRAGMIRKMASGLYNWLPLGLRVLRKVEAIVRREMDQAGAQEILMPVVQPAELWEESGRWEEYGPELCRIKDRHQRDFCLGPTHEEVITDLIRNELSSYKQLPANYYQIQSKFRDEVRPRFGVMRSREFIMKDAYSFHVNQHSLQATYDIMFKTYRRIFDRIGLDYRPVLADTGSIGGSGSHEFHVLADSGEDDIAFSSDSDYAANVELAEALAIPAEPEAQKDEVNSGDAESKTIDEVAKFLDISPEKTVKTLIVTGAPDEAGKETLVALVLRGDHTLNHLKAVKVPQVKEPLSFAEENRIKSDLGTDIGSIGPVGLNIPTIIDRSAAQLINFTCGANKNGFHTINTNWCKDKDYHVEDIRNVVVGDRSPCGKGSIEIKRGIEVGHIFQLGTKYSKAMNATVLDEQGQEQAMVMGCYGIGITRIIAASIEQNHDDKGIIWPLSIAPFQLAIVPINIHKSDSVKRECEHIYQALAKKGFDILFMDEPKARLGAMLADIELMGIPHRIVVGDRGLDAGNIEYRARSDSDNMNIASGEVLDFLTRVMTC